MPLVQARTSERNGNDETHCVDCVRTVHKTANVLDKLPKSVQPAAKADLREVWMAPNRTTAAAAIESFAEKYGAKYDKAVTCLLKDRSALLTFYDFPAEHWDHLRTSNPIESVFATVRHRTVRTKGALSQDTARLMVFKLVMAAAKTWRKLKGENQLPKVIQGVTFKDGVEVSNTPVSRDSKDPSFSDNKRHIHQ
jgi:putative transposase